MNKITKMRIRAVAANIGFYLFGIPLILFIAMLVLPAIFIKQFFETSEERAQRLAEEEVLTQQYLAEQETRRQAKASSSNE